MTTNNRSVQAPRIAGIDPQSQAARLLPLWSQLTHRAAEAAAHCAADEPHYRKLQRQVEKTIVDDLPEAVLAQMCTWEIEVMHDSEVSARECAVCRYTRRALKAASPPRLELDAAS